MSACKKIHTAMHQVLQWQQLAGNNTILVRLEDARLRSWYGDTGRELLQGAGSIKRECTIWQDFLDEKRIPYELVLPKRNQTKVNAAYFHHASGWKDKTNNHARDAGILVINY